MRQRSIQRKMEKLAGLPQMMHSDVFKITQNNHSIDLITELQSTQTHTYQ